MKRNWHLGSVIPAALLIALWIIIYLDRGFDPPIHIVIAIITVCDLVEFWDTGSKQSESPSGNGTDDEGRPDAGHGTASRIVFWYYICIIASACILGALLAWFYLTYEFDIFAHGILTAMVIFVLGAQIWCIRIVKKLRFGQRKDDDSD